MKRTLTLILAAILLSSTLSISAFADEETVVAAETTASETESSDTEESEKEMSENETPEAETPEAETPETETPEPGITVTETPEPEPEKKEEPHTITIANRMMEQGLVMPNRRTAKEGEVIVLTAFEREYEQNGKQYKYEFRGWSCDVRVPLIYVNKTTAFFFMPDEDVTIYPTFREVDITEYYNWDSVAKSVDKLHRNQTLEVDMENETTIPDSVLEALAGTDADVTFVTGNCIYTINGMDITMNTASDAAEGYSVTYEDYSPTVLQKMKIRNTDLVAIRVNVKTDHIVKANLRCFASKDKDTGYLYRVNGLYFAFVSEVEIKNGEANLPVTESGTYIVTSQALSGTMMQVKTTSNNTVAIVGGKLIPMSAVVDGKLTFKIESSGKLQYNTYTNTYSDVSNHKYKSQIDFVNARGLLDGVTEESWQPNAGITAGEIMRAVARLRGIPDKDAYDYCTQLDIFARDYTEEDLLSRNEMSVIMTNLVNHLIDHPKSFGEYSMRGFDDNAAAWVGARFRELKNNNSGEFNWNEYATRAEAAYLLQAVIQTVVAGD